VRILQKFKFGFPTEVFPSKFLAVEPLKNIVTGFYYTCLFDGTFSSLIGPLFKDNTPLDEWIISIWQSLYTYP
jgi:hypothetical protein